jgi:hypothetical protein
MFPRAQPRHSGETATKSSTRSKRFVVSKRKVLRGTGFASVRFRRGHGQRHRHPDVCFRAEAAFASAADMKAQGIRGSTRTWSRVWLDFRGLGEFESIFYVDAEISDCVLDFGVAQQNLNSAEVTCCLVNDRRFGTPQRTRSLFLRSKSDRHNPFAHEAWHTASCSCDALGRSCSGTHNRRPCRRSDLAIREDWSEHRSSTRTEPAACLLLHYHREGTNFRPDNQGAGLDLD